MNRTRRGLLVRFSVLLGLVVVALVLNVAGLAPFPGGPLSETGFIENPLALSTTDSSVVRGGAESGVYPGATLYSSDLILANGLPFTARLEKLVPISRSGAIEPIAAVTRSNPPAYPARFGAERPSTFTDPRKTVTLGETEVAPFFSTEQPNWAHVLVSVKVGAGVGRIGGFALYYHVGPFHFRTTWRRELLVCIPPVGEEYYKGSDCIAHGRT